MNKSEAIKYQDEHHEKHNIGGLADYVIDGLDSPIFEGATIKTFNHKSDYDNVIRELKRSGEYANNDLLMVNFNVDSKSEDMWVHELLDGIFDYFGTQREMSVADFESVCEEFKSYMGDNSEYEIAYFPDGDYYYDVEKNEALFFVEYTGRGDELVDITFCVTFEGSGETEDKPTKKRQSTPDYPSNVTLPLSGGFTKEQEKAYERSLGSDWRDLFNGL